MLMPWRVAIVFCLMAGAGWPTAPASTEFAADADGHARTVAPFLQTHCTECHGAEKQKGNLRVDEDLTLAFLDPAVRGRWAEVVDVLNSHEMPPEDSPQPGVDEVAAVVDWITAQMVRAEDVQREGTVVLRRLNREEYRNTLRDLLGVEADVSAFPVDASSEGFDTNGQALTLSPVLVELYLDTARRALDRALVTAPAPPPTVRWRFEFEHGKGDDHRQRLDETNNPIVHGGQNLKREGFTVIHHASWDRHPNARDFRMPVDGEYAVRVRAAGSVPDRAAVVASARRQLERRLAESKAKGESKEAEWQSQNLQHDLDHFRADRMYDYGPPRLKLIQALAGQPRVLAEFDTPAPAKAPAVHEITARFTTDTAGLTLEYAYSIPKVLENFWMQERDDFARPEALVDWLEIEGPLHPEWPPTSHRLVLGTDAAPGESTAEGLPADPQAESARARAVLARFMARAYRRPVRVEEIEAKLSLFTAARAGAGSFLEAIKIPLTAVLASPHFLYLAEPHPATREARPLTPHELASRLSYFLWSTMPDETLAALATDGTLARPDVFAAQVDRLLADPRAGAFTRNFAGQWLGLRQLGANPPAPDLYPQYDRHLESSLAGETLAFFREILDHDLPVENFLRSDFVVINERLARFYGIDGVRGDHLRRVAVPAGVPRGGLVTQASMLALTSNGTRTSPVKRGTWVLKTLLGTDPGLPVANAGDIKPRVPGIDKATVRQRLAIHREHPQCARCHNKIDPLGLALENFNAAGEWRAQEGFGYNGRIEKDDPVIDATATMPDGTPIDGVDGLRDALVAKKSQFHQALASRLLTYALGRELSVADRPAVLAAARAMEQNGHSLRALIKAVVASPVFQSK
jgi:mono/diheme cytochrome c family protein